MEKDWGEAGEGESWLVMKGRTTGDEGAGGGGEFGRRGRVGKAVVEGEGRSWLEEDGEEASAGVPGC